MSTALPTHLQARYHAGCALRHLGRALLASLRSPRILCAVAALAAVWLLAGCESTPKAPPVRPEGRDAAVSAAGARADAATASADGRADEAGRKTGELLSKLKSNVVSARAANQGNPDGAPRTKVEGELGVAEGRLGEVQADPVELAAAAQRDLLVEQGRAAEARSAYDRAAADARGQAAELARAQQEAAQARLERDAARAQEKAALADFERRLEENARANQRARDELEARHRRELDEAAQQVLREQVAWLNRAAAGCAALAVLSFGLAAMFGGLASLRLVGPFSAILGLGALVCFGLAQIVGQWWFKWAILAAVLAVLALVAWWVLKKQKEGTLKQKLEGRAASLQGLLTQVVPVLDKAYEGAEQSGKELLDRTIFQPLSSTMNRDEKALVHQLRAQPTGATVAATPTT